MPEHERSIPFSNIVYIGDGLTDVPSMTVAKGNGGHTIAVYKKKSAKGQDVCKELLAAQRVHFIAPADYSEESLLENRVKRLLKSVIAEIEYQRELFACRRENHLLHAFRLLSLDKEGQGGLRAEGQYRLRVDFKPLPPLNPLLK